MALKILADSASDLPLNFFSDHNVTLFPLNVHLDDKEYADLIEIEPSQVYQAIRDGKIPKTSQVSPHLFEEVFSKMAKNKEAGIYIAFSSQLSGTYSTAVMIFNQVKEQYPDFDLTIIDTKCASIGQGLVVLEAAKLAQQNASKETIIEDVKFRSQHMEHLFTVNDLEYLAKGGRVSKASAFLGGLLNIKPLLNVDDGKLVPLEKLRGKKKLMHRVIEIMKERGSRLDIQQIGISHADNEEAALEIKKMIQQEFGTEHIVITDIGAVIGAHVGPGTMAIVFLNKIPS